MLVEAFATAPMDIAQALPESVPLGISFVHELRVEKLDVGSW